MRRRRLFDKLMQVMICLCIPAASLFAQAGSLAGSVIDQSNNAVAGAFITANRESLPAAHGRAFSAADGTFQISGLPAGSFTVCVQVRGGEYLDTCEWQILPLRVDVKAGQAVAGLKFKLQKGAVLQIRLNDPGNLLSPSATAKTVPQLLMGVQAARGLFRPATLVSRDATGTTHAVTIPFDMAVNFTIRTPQVALADGNGAPISAAGSDVPVTVRSGTSPPTLTFNVTGPK